MTTNGMRRGGLIGLLMLAACSGFVANSAGDPDGGVDGGPPTDAGHWVDAGSLDDGGSGSTRDAGNPNSDGGASCAPGAQQTGTLLDVAVSPTLCGQPVTKTCVGGVWSRPETLYPACTQRCLNPDTNQPLLNPPYVAYTVSSGNEAACAAARVTSNCDRATGLLAPAPPPAPRYGACSAPPPSDGGLPTWVENLPLWQWHPIPGTALSSVEPNPRPFGDPASKISSWNGAGLKKKGSVYLVALAGGHADYAGNEVDALALNTETPRWVELKPPSASQYVINAAQYYLDYWPSPTHTYRASQFIDALDRLLVIASPGMGASALPAPPPGWPYTGDRLSASFNLAANAWDAPDYIARFPGNGDWTSALVAKHPITEDIYYSRNYSDGWYRWSAAGNTWSKLSSRSRGPWYAGAAIDPTRNRMLVVGGYGAQSPAEVLDLSGNNIAANFSGPSLQLDSYTGVLYEPLMDRFLVFRNANPIEVLMVNPSTWAVEALSASSNPALTGTPPGQRQNGIHNAVQYVPELRGFVLANTYNGNVFFVRTAP